MNIKIVNDMYNNGTSIRKIALKFGVSAKTVRKHISVIDRTRKYPSIGPVSTIKWESVAQRNELIIQLSSKYNAPTIARILQIDKSTAYEVLGKLGIAQGHRPRYYTVDATAEAEIVELYKNNVPTTKIAQKFNIDSDNVIRICKRHAITTNSSSAGLRISNHSDEYNFFECLDSADKLYIIGLLCADGNIHKDVVTLALKKSDEGLLKSINEHIGTNYGSISYVTNRRNNKDSVLARLRICKVKVREDLDRHGILDFKRDNPRIMCSLTDEEFRQFLRGFFDGDGVLCHELSRCGFVGLYNIMVYISERINVILGFKFCLQKHANIWRLATADKNNMRIFLAWLYKDATLYLDRKYKLANKWVQKLSPVDVIWRNDFRFMVSGYEDKPPSYIIRVKKEIMAKVKSWAPLQYSHNELNDDYEECKKENPGNYIHDGGLRSGHVRTPGRSIMVHFNPHIWSVKTDLDIIPNMWNIKNVRRCLNILMDEGGRVTTERIIREMQFRVRCRCTSMMAPGFARALIRQSGLIKGSIIFDPCGGWGGRLLATKLEGMHYICTELSAPTYNGLNEINTFINHNAHIINRSCIDYEWPTCDLILTSPPFYNTEDYGGGDGFISKEDWISRFLKPFIAKINTLCMLHVNEDIRDCVSSIRKPDEIMPVAIRKHARAKVGREYVLVYK